MAYDEGLAERVRDVLAPREVAERRMFGGLGWMLGGNLAVAVMSTGGLIVRADPEDVPQLLAEPHAGPFGREGAKPMAGMVLVAPEGLEDDEALARWCDVGASRAAALPPK